MSNYNTYALKCYDTLKTHLEPHADLELPQVILQKIAGFSLGAKEGCPPLSFRYIEIMAVVLAIGGRLHWEHTHSDIFLDEQIPATPMGLGAQWSYLTTELLQAYRTAPSVVNTRYSTLINSVAAQHETYGHMHTLSEFLHLIKKATR